MQAVSRALRGKDDIPPATRKKILETAERLGYVKNLAASALKAGHSRLIAVIYDNLLNPYFSIMTAHLQESFKSLGYSILIVTAPSGRIAKEVFFSAVSRGADGIITFLEPSAEVGSLAISYGVPIILLGRSAACNNIDYLKTDDRKGGALAATHLVNAGCKTLLCVTEKMDMTCAQDRFDGYKEELTKLGLFDPKMVIVLENITPEQAYATIKSREIVPDGIFCFNDLIAFDIINSAKKDGVNIKVVGYDNIQEDINIPYRLTTIGSDKKQMATVAAEVLICKIENPEMQKKSFQKLHDVYLVEGESA